MQASIVELRYHMKDVLKALDRNEIVRVLYRGKVKATLVPESSKTNKISAKQHPLFGMDPSEHSVDRTMEEFRGGCVNAI